MKRWRVSHIQSLLRWCSAVATAVLLTAGVVSAATLTGRVVGVHDGDTITVLDADRVQHKIRLQGIDAPELGQAFGSRSKQNLSRYVAGKDVRLDCNKIDRYRRDVCNVWVQPADCPSCGMTLNAGLAQITDGMAWWYRQYAREQTPEDRGRYESAEEEARLRRWGLWRDNDPTPPWEWRAAKRASHKNP